MTLIIRLIPGLIAAIAALIAMRLIGIFGFVSATFQVIVFVVAYIVTAIAIDSALRRYGRSES